MLSSDEIGREIVLWGTGQDDDAVAQTIARTQQVSPEVVKEMIGKGLTRAWVLEQRSRYIRAKAAGGKKLGNRQLLPRLELMDAILRDWPND
jgi:hypothetical protein